MGVYHQGGVVPAQIWLGKQRDLGLGLPEIFWWRTYSPPVWLLDGNRLQVTDLMGMDVEDMIARLGAGIGDRCGPSGQAAGLVAPRSSTELDKWTAGDGKLAFQELWTYTAHLGLDDLNFGAEGISDTLKRVVGRRGLTVWMVQRKCTGSERDN